MNQSIDRTCIATSGVDSESLSAQQRRFWALDQLERADAPHNVAACLGIRGKLDAITLENAIRAVLERHEVLRSRFVLENDEPRAVTSPTGFLSLPAVTLTQVPPTERKEATFALAAKELHQAFDLQSGPVFRATLYKLDDSDHLLALTFPTIVCDSFSSLILTKEIAAAYDAIVNSAPLPPLGLQYSDYIRSQEHYLRGGQYERDLAFWKNKLENAPAGVELPADRPRPLAPSFQGAEQLTVISGDLLDALRTFSGAEQSSTFLTLLSAFFCVLARYTGGEDLVIGTEVSGRNDSEMAKVLGAVSNQLVLRADCSGDPNFRNMLHRISQLWAEAKQHQSLPFGTLLDTLRVRRDVGRNPVFQVSFSRGVAAERIDIADLHWEPVRLDTETAILDLSVNVIESDQEIEMQFSYGTDLFEHATIARMIGHFRTFLQAAIENPEQAVSGLSLLTPAEQHQILVKWNSTAAEYPATKGIHELVQAQSERTPDMVAVVWKDQELSYRELNARANQLAHYLRGLGVGPEVFVGICVERSLDMIIGLLGVLKAGGAYVPLDPSYPLERLAFILEDTRAPVLLTQQRLKAQLPPFPGRLVSLDADWPSIATGSRENPISQTSADNLAYVIYTSGSTGTPKGVEVCHRGVVRLLFGVNYARFGTGRTFLSLAPLAFDASTFEIWGGLLHGGRCIIYPDRVPNAKSLREVIERHGVSTVWLTSSLFNALVDEDVAALSGVEQLLTGGEALSVWHVRRALKALPGTELVNGYGPTESTTFTCCYPIPRLLPEDASSVPIGRPIGNTVVYVVDEHLKPVPIGVPGELYIGGDGLARGYLNRPELTLERFIPSPFSDDPSARLYKTGDRVRYRSDGNLEFLGRFDDQVKVRGHRIELGEIEAVLGQYAGVGQVVVVVREDNPGDKQLVAYVRPASESITPSTLRAYLHSKLPEFMVPSKFVVLERFPLTTGGKVDRRALPAPQIEPRDGDLIPPRNDSEALLASLFQEILNVESVSIRDDFFELGGHSLTAARLVSQINETIGRKIPLGALFHAATVESLAQLIEQEPELGSDPVLMQIKRGESDRLPFFAIVPPGERSLGYAMLARHMGRDQAVYKVQGHAPVTYSKRPYSEQEMQDLTNEYIAAMRTVQPSGPYCLGGECDGALISEQIVLNLEAQGEEVGLFAIFDTWVLQHSQRRWLWKLQYYRERLRDAKGLNLTGRLAAYLRLAGNKVQTLAGQKSVRTDWQEAYWPQNFIAPRFRAPVILFKRPKQPFYYVKDAQMGWGARSQSGVEIHEIEFSHYEILREPHVRVFGEKLAERIAKLSQRAFSSRSTQEGSESSLLTASVQQPQHGS